MTKRVLLYFCAFAGILLTACGAPLAPVASRWEPAASIPNDYRPLKINCVGPKGLYGIPADGSTVVVYDGLKFIEDFTAPPGIEFDDVAFFGAEGWLTAARGPEPYEPALFRFKNGAWTEDNCDFGPINV